MKTLAIFPNMSSYEKTDELFKKLNIGVWEHFIDIVYLVEINTPTKSFLIIGNTNNIFTHIRELYQNYHANTINILRLINVNTANPNWERCDYSSELYSCFEEFKIDNSNKYYDIAKKSDILESFDNKLEKDLFDSLFIFKNNNLQVECKTGEKRKNTLENNDPDLKRNKSCEKRKNTLENNDPDLKRNKMDEEQDYFNSMYDSPCIGKGCKEFTNGSQYCAKTYCITEELNPYK